MYWVSLTDSSSSALYWIKQVFIIDMKLSTIRYYKREKLSFEHNAVLKNFFSRACRCWDDRFSSRDFDQKDKFGGIISYGDSYLEFMFCHSKKLRLHATLHDDAGAVGSKSAWGSGYCYKIKRGRNSSKTLGQMTGLFFWWKIHCLPFSSLLTSESVCPMF